MGYEIGVGMYIPGVGDDWVASSRAIDNKQRP